MPYLIPARFAMIDPVVNVGPTFVFLEGLRDRMRDKAASYSFGDMSMVAS